MERYDGPAFYKKTIKKEEATSRNDDRFIRKEVKMDSQNEKSQINHYSRGFRPKQIPTFFTSKKQNKNVKYRQLLVQLTKAKDTYLLFDDQADNYFSEETVELPVHVDLSATDDVASENLVSANEVTPVVEKRVAQNELLANTTPIPEVTPIVDVTPRIVANNKHALARGLFEITNSENEAQKELAVFKDKPEVSSREELASVGTDYQT
ncbi:hypothetical protein N0K75_06230, partial [Dellaglioa sp. TMW 2.2533]|nr:hypothetical protein [Dellaglioa carnosa]